MRAWTWLASWRWLQSCKRERVVVVGGVGFFCGFVIGGGEWEIVIVGGVIGVFDEEGGQWKCSIWEFLPHSNPLHLQVVGCLSSEDLCLYALR